MCSTLVAWLRPSREAQHRHQSAAQQFTAEAGIQDGTHWRQQSKRTRVFAIRRAEGGPQAIRTYAAESFGMDGTRKAWA